MNLDTYEYLAAVDAWLAELHKDLEFRLSVFTLPEPPRLRDFESGM